MTKPTGDVEALKRMQSDAANLRAERKRHRSTKAQAKEHPSDTESNQPATEGQSIGNAAEKDQTHEAGTDVGHYADQLAVAVKQMEDTAREHPALALLAAFTTGVVVGNLFSRG